MRAVVATVALAAGLVTGIGAAGAAPSCVGQAVSSAERGELGPYVSGVAHEHRPLGAMVSREARSPKDACPVEQ